MDEILIRFENLKDKNPLKALHLIKQALIQDPKNFDYLVSLATHFSKINEIEKALIYFEKAQRVAAFDDHTTFAYAITLMKDGQYKLAIKQFNKLNDVFPESYYNSALCYVRMNDLKKAVLEAENLDKHEMLGRESLRLIIDIYNFSRDSVKLKSALNKYKVKYGDDDYYHLISGRDAYLKSNFLEVVYHFSRIKEEENEQNMYLNEYAFSLCKIKRFDKAVLVYQEIIEKGQPTEYVLYEYIEVLFQLNRFHDVLDVLKKYKSIIKNKEKIHEIEAKVRYKLELE